MVSPLSWGRGCRLDETREQDISFPGPSSGHRLKQWAGPPNQKEIGEPDRLSTITTPAPPGPSLRGPKEQEASWELLVLSTYYAPGDVLCPLSPGSH